MRGHFIWRALYIIAICTVLYVTSLVNQQRPCGLLCRSTVKYAISFYAHCTKPCHTSARGSIYWSETIVSLLSPSGNNILPFQDAKSTQQASACLYCCLFHINFTFLTKIFPFIFHFPSYFIHNFILFLLLFMFDCAK
jgi:hypothetical protein